ncbi:hypothetical protein BDZ89DRAFT_696417 [Hymenopellis radicata]|nr:hypothetical protein BDZ89DRAFT_696417 [Hymenopellis radicata]
MALGLRIRRPSGPCWHFAHIDSPIESNSYPHTFNNYESLSMSCSGESDYNEWPILLAVLESYSLTTESTASALSLPTPVHLGTTSSVARATRLFYFVNVYV